jgi:hypothetical protein
MTTDEIKFLIDHAYAAFNRRDIDAALAFMTTEVSWPKASEGGRVTGKEEVRAYWTRQWSEFDPQVQPLSITTADDGRIRIQVRQIVKSLEGTVLFNREVTHIVTLENGLIAAMHLGDQAESPDTPTAAFARKH